MAYDVEMTKGSVVDAADRAWETPDFHYIGANEAEAGILVGPEILLLLS